MTVVATDVVHDMTTEVVGVVSAARRRTPIAATVTSVVEPFPDMVARSRKEDAVAVRSFYFIAVNAVLYSPCPGTVCFQFV